MRPSNLAHDSLATRTYPLGCEGEGLGVSRAAPVPDNRPSSQLPAGAP
jgi:hypothetical protein